jgi:hypothetical protein
MTIRRALLVAFVGLLAAGADCQTPDPTPRGGAGAGMGVDYLKRTDIVNLVNRTPGVLERLPDFKAGAEFFGFVTVPLSATWALKLDYTFMIASYNVETTTGTAEFALTTHAPSVLLQYVLTERGVYNFKIGAGAGPRFGALSEKYLYLDDTFSSTGVGFALELEGNTALGEDLFVHLAAGARWESVGEAKNELGKSPGSATSGSPVTLDGFGVGVRLGLTYYFY